MPHLRKLKPKGEDQPRRPSVRGTHLRELLTELVIPEGSAFFIDQCQKQISGKLDSLLTKLAKLNKPPSL